MQCGGLRQGHISRKHNHQAVIGQLGNCLLHRMAGSQLGLLTRKQQVKTGFSALCACESCFHFCSTMTRNHHGRARLQLRGRIQHMLQQGATGQLLQHFGMAAFHAGAFAGGHDDDVQRCGHSCS